MDKEIIKLLETLEKKNSYLLEFHQINTNEIDRLNGGCTDNLENFYYSREILLNAIDQLDLNISKKDLKKESLEINPLEKKKLKELLKLKKDTVLSILDQDLIIISLVEKLQNKYTMIA